jgi:hypothetical protein
MQNLRASDIPKNSQTANNYIGKVLKHLLSDYKNTREERRQIGLWEESKDFSILGKLAQAIAFVGKYSPVAGIIVGDNNR